MSSTFQNAALGITNYGLYQALLGYFDVDLGQMFSIYIVIYTLYQVGRDHYCLLYDYILCVRYIPKLSTPR